MDLKRDLSPALRGAIAAPFFFPVMLVHLDWPGGAVRAHSGAGTISWAGHDWAGVGAFGNISAPEESLSGVPVEFSASLTCPIPELAAYADAVVRQRPGTIHFGATTEPGGNVLIGDPAPLITGMMDTTVLRTSALGDEDVLYSLTVTCDTGPGYRSSAAIHHSHEDQTRKFPGDTAGLRLMQLMAKAQRTLWPAP